MKYKALIILCLASTIIGCVAASTNNELPNLATQVQNGITPKTLPSIELADLDGQSYVFPRDLNTGNTLMIFGFSHSQKEDVEQWRQQILSRLDSSNKKVTVYKVPVIDNSTMALRSMIRNGMRTGAIDAAARKATLPLFIDKTAFANLLGLENTTEVCAILFDQAGTVVAKVEGPASESKISSILQIHG